MSNTIGEYINMSGINRHLNLFDAFKENTEIDITENDKKDVIENNLSRAFAICLLNDSLFFNEFLKEILDKQDYEQLFNYSIKDTDCIINLQIDTKEIEKENYITVYPVAMTSNKDLKETPSSYERNSGYRENTDIMISIKDIAIIIEVKKDDTDCIPQLLSQVKPFRNNENCDVKECKNFPWQSAIKLMQKVTNIQSLTSHNSIFIKDFLELCERKFTSWLEPKPLKFIKFSENCNDSNNIQIYTRLKQAFAEYPEALEYADRISAPLTVGWASEVTVDLDTDRDNGTNCVLFSIWPGNTKQQGYELYKDDSLAWINKKILTVNTQEFKQKEFKLNILYDIKFCHFNRYVTHITFSKEDIKEPIHTKNNFNDYSGKWKREEWDELEQFLGKHFKSDFNWKEKCDWDNKFKNTDRNYLTMSLGFEVVAYVPYEEFQEIDQKDEDLRKVVNLISGIIIGFKGLI